MVKRAKLAAKKAKKLLEGDKTAAPEPAAQQGGPAPPLHIQRKLTRKVKFLERVAATRLATTKSGVAKKKKRRPSVALTNLASLTDSLNDAAAALSAGGANRRQFGCSVGTQRGREKVAEVETQRLQQVLQHPQFMANPLAAITSHLQATLPAAPEPLSKQQQKEPAQLRREKKKRRKERAAAAAEMGDE